MIASSYTTLETALASSLTVAFTIMRENTLCTFLSQSGHNRWTLFRSSLIVMRIVNIKLFVKLDFDWLICSPPRPGAPSLLNHGVSLSELLTSPQNRAYKLQIRTAFQPNELDLQKLSFPNGKCTDPAGCFVSVVKWHYHKCHCSNEYHFRL